MKTVTHDLRDTLDGREVEIYELLCKGLNNLQISELVSMSVDGVRWHLKNIYKKLGVEAKNTSDKQSARTRAILYSGTKIEQVVSYGDKSDKSYALKHIMIAAKKTGISSSQIENLVNFLEMED